MLLSASKMKGIMLDHWDCITDDPETLKIIVDQFSCIDSDSIVRKSKNRTVFKIRINNISYYVKINHPSALPHKLKGIVLRQKAKSEFISLQKLQALGLPAVKAVGWGRHLSKSFLVTEDAGLEYLNARDFWLKTCVNNLQVREKYLSSLGRFIAKCVSANIIHPDFHLGNLLVKKEKNDFYFLFVDAYGVRSGLIKQDIFSSGIASIFASLIYELSEEEFKYLLVNSGTIKTFADFGKTVLEIKKYAALFANKRWGKRKAKLLSKESRFSLKYVDPNKNIWYLRKDVFGQSLFSLDYLNELLLSGEYNHLNMSRKKTIHCWLHSFYLYFHQIPHLKPLAIYLPHKRDNNAIIVSEKYSINEIKKVSACSPKLKKILEQCKLCGIKVINPSQDIVLINGKAHLIDSDPQKFRLNCFSSIINF